LFPRFFALRFFSLESISLPLTLSPHRARQTSSSVYLLVHRQWALPSTAVRIYYTDVTTGKTVFKDISVGGIAAAPANATMAQASAASKAKMQAIVKAINAPAIPIKPVTINGTTYSTLTATANDGTVANMYNTGKTMVQIINGVPTQVPVLAPAEFSTYTVNGATQTVINPGTPTASLSSGVFRTPGNTTTGEIGNGTGKFTPGAPSGGGGGMAQATFGGLGALTGLTTGLDPSEVPSVIGFGFLDETSSTPVDYIAAFLPSEGMDDEQVLTKLSLIFNQDFSVDGYTSTYDPVTDTLSIDQLLSPLDYTWAADSDTGLFLDNSFNTVPTPEPDSVVLLGTGLIDVLLLLRRKAKMESTGGRLA
jgi:hypothetical protein